MLIIPGNAQHIGTRREQQDDFGFSDLNDQDFVNNGGVLAVIADGMGGLAMGREASRLAKQTMLRAYEAKTPEESIPAALTRALEVANAAVYELSRQAGQEGEVGTTLVAAVIKDQELHWVSVGDSRIYLYRQGELFLLTTDHDYGRELARMAAAGEITWEEASSDPNRRALTSYLGIPQLLEVDRNSEPEFLEPGDLVLLCSDGLYGNLTEEEMADLLETHPQEAAELLVEATVQKNLVNQDNLTVAIMACQREGLLHRLSSLPYFPNLPSWQENWRQLTCAALIGAMLAASGVWLANRYWSHGVSSAPVTNTAISARESVKPALDAPTPQATTQAPAASIPIPPKGAAGAVSVTGSEPPREDKKLLVPSTMPPLLEKQEPARPPKAGPPNLKQSKKKGAKKTIDKTESESKKKKFDE
jgi:serine/threonine protein phosphatase PrpC